MSSLANFIHSRGREMADNARRASGETIDGIVSSIEGSNVNVMIGDTLVLAQPAVAQSLSVGDHVWVLLHSGQPLIIGVGTSDTGVPRS